MGVIFDTGIVFGVQEPRPIENLPEGAKVRIRLRCDDFGTAFVRTRDGIEEFLLSTTAKGTWRLTYPQRKNLRVTSA